jgi:hypothetical protein
MSIDRQDVIDRLQAIFTAHTTPAFTVVTGEPLALAPDGSPFLCFWYLGDTEPPEGRMTFTNVMVMERFQVICLWHRVLELEAFEALEKEIWDANRTLKAALRGDSTLNNEATDLDIKDSQVDYGVFPLDGSPYVYRSLEFELHIKDLEAEAIAP